MNTSIRFFMLLIFLVSVAALAGGCDGGGSASGGIGGSGVQALSVGSVSDVGSITVNGVSYQTTSATVIDDDGDAFPEGNLAKGMVVEVEGEIETDGINGTADQVVVMTAVQGPVDQVFSASDITVMGQPVAIGDATEIDDSIITLGGIVALTSSNIVEVHGTVDPNGITHATRIEDKTGSVALPPYKVRGFVNAVAPPTFTINGLTINYGSAAQNDFGSNGPTIGDFVSVKGALLGSGTLTADRVEDEDRSLGENTNAEIEGFITNINGATFTLVTGAGTFQFSVDGATEVKGGTVGDLVVGLEVEVEGTFSGGILIADEINVKDGIRLENSVDISSRNMASLTISPDEMSSLILKLNNQTEIDENRSGFPMNPTPAQLLASLDGSESFRVRARVSNAVIPNTTELLVTRFRVFDGLPSAVELRGPLDGPPAQNGDLQILGVTISSATTLSFFDIDDIAITRTEFLNQVTTGTLVDAEGVMTADNMMDASELAIED